MNKNSLILHIKQSELIIQTQNNKASIIIMAEPQYTILKLAIVSSSKVGKSALLRREVENTFDQSIYPTIGIDFKIKYYMVGQTNIKAQLWDSTYVGQKFKIQSTQFFTRCHSVGVCFSLNDRKSFEEVGFWLKLARSNPQTKVWIIGCKSDLEHAVSNQEIHNYLNQNNLHYVQTSSKLNVGVNELFNQMAVAALQAKLNEPKQGINIKPLNPPKKQQCSIM